MKTELNIWSNDKASGITITVDGTAFHFARTTATAEDAVAVREHVSRGLGEQIEKVRRIEYKRGWNRRARKQSKETSWGSTLWLGDWMVKELSSKRRPARGIGSLIAEPDQMHAEVQRG